MAVLSAFAPPSYATAVIVHPNGTTQPFQASANTDAAAGTSLAAAVAAAASGDTIYVYRNALVTTNLLKNGVNWYFAPGVTITMSQNVAGFIFTDGGSAAICTIGGNGSFTRSVTGTDGTIVNLDTGILLCSNASSDISFEWNTCATSFPNGSVNNGGSQAAIVVNAGKFNGNGQRMTTNNLTVDTTSDLSTGVNSQALWWGNGEMNVVCNEIYALGTRLVDWLVQGKVTGAATGDFNLLCQQLICNSDSCYAVQLSANNSATASWVTANKIRGGILIDGGKYYQTSQKQLGFISVLPGTDFSPTNPANTEFHLITEKAMPSSIDFVNPMIACDGSGSSGTTTAWITVNKFDVSGVSNVTQLVDCEGGGVVHLSGMDFTAVAGQDAIFCTGTGSVVNLYSGKITTDSNKKDLHVASSGTINVTAAVVYDGTKTTGAITKLNTYGAAPA